ncbi:unnamed protein product [Prorocentrum cordatum]|uniref:Uncharacterized protein n=1 Tax=Prorocentrum cordatum TaxID=2364126 RepID=A0ABN9TY14_9DINO|nr:unnamed protein product [Polarella glacialis]
MSRRTSQEIIGKEISCHLCESTEPCYKVAWGVMFGQACFAKVRANHRRLQQMPHGKQDVVDDKKQMIEDPGTWRRQEFFRSDEHRAQQKALARVTANFTEQTKIHQTVDVQDDVGLSDDFDELHDRQVVEDAHDMTDTCNRKLVWVKYCPRHRRLSGHQTLEGARRGGGGDVGGGLSSSCGTERTRGRTEPAGDDVHDRDPPGKKLKGSKSGAAGAALPDDGEGKTEGAKFLEQRQSLVQTLTAMAAQLGSSKGVKSSVQGMVIEIQKKNIDGDLLPLQPAALEGDISTALDDIKKQLDNAKKVKPHEISGCMDSVAALQAQLKDLTKRRDELRSAVNFCVKEVRDKERADGHKVYWAKYSIEKRLINGGFGKLHGKKLSQVIYALQGAEGDAVAQYPGIEDDGRQTFMSLEIGKPQGEVDLEKFGFWPTGHETIAELAKIYGDSQVVKDKIAAMQAALTSNPSWAGAVVNIEGLTDAEELKRIFGQVGTGDGCEPWLLSGRMGCCRHGPPAFALPGVASMVYTTEKPVHFQLSEVGPILEKGFCIKEYAKYLESSDGQSFLDANAWAVRLQPFSFFYMPDGFIVLWVYYADDRKDSMPDGGAEPKPTGKKAKAKVKASDKAADAAFLVSVPVFTDASKQLQPKVRKAIHSYNMEVIKSKGKDPKWENRGMKLDEYFKDAS